MKYSELTKKLRRLGAELYRQGKGSHEVWWLLASGKRTTIPNHGSRELRASTLREILRDLDLTEDDLAPK